MKDEFERFEISNQKNIPENFSPSQCMVCLLVLVYFSIYFFYNSALTQVDPHSTRLKNLPDSLHILDDIVSCVNKEAGSHTVPGI